MLVNVTTGLTPGEAYRRAAQLQLQLWREQYEVSFFIHDVRSDVYLRNEIIAYWQGRVSEIHGWTDPLGQVCTWISDNILKPLNDAISGVAAAVIKLLDPVLEPIRLVLNIITNAISGVANAIWNFIKPGFTWISDAIGGLLTALSSAISGVATAIWNFIGPTLNGIIESIKSIPDVIKGIPGAISSAFQAVGTVLMSALKWVWDNVLVPLGGAIKSGLQAVVNSLGGIATTIVYQLFGAVHAHSPQTPEESFAAIRSVLMVGGAMLGTLGIAYVVGELAHPLKEMGLGHLAAMIWRASNYDIVTGAIIGAWAHASFGQPLRYYFNNLFQPWLPTFEDAVTMRMRGMITEARFTQISHYHGYSDEWGGKLFDIKRAIPNVQDFVTFVVRESFPLEALPAAPSQFIESVKLWGMEEKYARAYWWIHWKLPAFDQLREAYWRNIITLREFTQYVVWHDYAPFARGGIAKSDQSIMNELIYRMPGRMEARFMARWGQIKKEDLATLTRMDGVHPDWIERIVDAEMMQLVTDERSSVRTATVDLFVLGQITRDALDGILAGVKFTDQEIELSLMAADYKLIKQEVDDATEALKYSYRLGKITIEQLAAGLNAIPLMPDKVQRIVMIEKSRTKEILLKTPEEDIAASGKEIAIKRFRDGVTDEAGLEAEMTMLGYILAQIERSKIIARLERDYDLVIEARKPVKVQEEAIIVYGRDVAVSRYVEGMTNDADLEQELKMGGYTPAQIDRYRIIARLKRDYDMAMLVMSNLKSAYLAKKIGDETFIGLAREYKFTDEKIMLELGLAKLRRGVGLEEAAA